MVGTIAAAMMRAGVILDVPDERSVDAELPATDGCSPAEMGEVLWRAYVRRVDYIATRRTGDAYPAPPEWGNLAKRERSAWEHAAIALLSHLDEIEGEDD